MNLHDWIDELCDVLDLETEVDEGLVNDLADLANKFVESDSGSITTYLLGYAAGSTAAGPATIERLAAKASELAEAWDRPTGADEVEDDVVVDDGSIADIVDLDDDDDADDDEDDEE